jgi:hypothetical protein
MKDCIVVTVPSPELLDGSPSACSDSQLCLVEDDSLGDSASEDTASTCTGDASPIVRAAAVRMTWSDVPTGLSCIEARRQHQRIYTGKGPVGQPNMTWLIVAGRCHSYGSSGSHSHLLAACVNW